MIEWKEYKLGDLIKDIAAGPFGSNLKVECFVESGFPIIDGANLKGFKVTDNITKFVTEEKARSLHRSIAKRNDVIVTISGNVGQIAYIPNDSKFIEYLVSQRQFRVSFDESAIDVPYLVYYFHTREGQHKILSFANQVGVPALAQPLKNFKAIELNLPSLPTQRRIASILSSLDDKIDLLHRENATLEQMAETLFRQWFVVEAKEEWEEGKLGDFVIETVGGEWGKENPEGDFTKAVQCIRGTDIADLNVGLANKTPIRFVKESKFEKIEPLNGDIIMEISGGTENQSTGRVTYINEDVKALFQHPIVFSNFCRLLRVDEKNSYFLFCYLKYLYDQDEYFNLENGSSGIKNLDYKALLYDLTYPMPQDKRLIFEFNDNVSLYFKKINRNKQQIQTLIQARDGLLPKLMSNEINIAK